MELKPAGQGDRDLCARLLRVFYEQEPGMAPLTQARAQEKADKLLEAAADGRVVLLLLCCEETVAGYALLTFFFSNEYDGSIGLLDEFLILPEHQGKGLGGRFLDELKNWARGRGLTRLLLEVTDKNPRVVGLYERKGFALLERRIMAWPADSEPQDKG